MSELLQDDIGDFSKEAKEVITSAKTAHEALVIYIWGRMYRLAIACECPRATIVRLEYAKR